MPIIYDLLFQEAPSSRWSRWQEARCRGQGVTSEAREAAVRGELLDSRGLKEVRGQRGSARRRTPPRMGERQTRHFFLQLLNFLFLHNNLDIILPCRDSQQLFVGNMPHGCTEEDLSDLFSKFGRVLEVRINQKQGRETAGRGRDGKTGFVSFIFFITSRI